MEKKKEIKEFISKVYENEKKFSTFDNEFGKIDRNDTENYFGMVKNQPLLAIDTLEVYYKELNDDKEFLKNVLRSFELTLRETIDFLQLSSNIFYRLFFELEKIFEENNKTLADNLFNEEIIVDFLIRTKGFCFLNKNFFIDDYDIYENEYRDFMQRFFKSDYLPKDLKVDFSKLNNLKKILKKTKEIKENFELNEFEEIVVLGTITGFELPRNTKKIVPEINYDFLEKFFVKTKNQSFIFDAAFSSELFYSVEQNKLPVDNTLTPDINKMILNCFRTKMFSSMLSLNHVFRFFNLKQIDYYGTLNYNRISTKYYYDWSRINEQKYGNENWEFYGDEYTFVEKFDKYLLDFFDSSGSDDIERFLNISKYKDDKPSYLFDLKNFKELILNTEVGFSIPQFLGILYNAFPYLLKIEIYIPGRYFIYSHGTIVKETVKEYLERGGSYSNVKEIEKNIKKK